MRRATDNRNGGRQDDSTPLIEILDELSSMWEREPSDPAIEAMIKELAASRADDGAMTLSTTSRLRRIGADDTKLRLRLTEEIAAARVVQYIASVLRHIRWIAGFLLIALVITSLLISSYSFQPARLVSLVFMTILFGTVGALVYVSLEMNREDLLSRVTGSDPGKVNWSIGFIVNLTLVGVVPILLAVSSQFPMIRNALFAWVDPIVREVLHG